MFTDKDIQLFEKKGISIEKANWQIDQFKKGILPIKLISSATINKGIKLVDDPEYYAELYNNSDVISTKFVPASGAASRMFKALFEYRDACSKNENELPPPNETISLFFSEIKKFAFYTDLEELLKEYGVLERIVAEKKYKLILDTLLDDEGLAYGSLPKGLLKFHFYAGNIGRTPFEEHLVEGAKYALSSDGKVNLHFTVSPEHIDLFKSLLDKVLEKYTDMYRVEYDVSFSVQKSSTDTIAVNPDNTPFYDEDGDIFFRPGGHGALIENLNEIDSDIIFIKNIDNVVPEKKVKRTVLMKQAFAGLLIEIQNKIFSLCKVLKEGATEEAISEAKDLIQNTLHLKLPEKSEEAAYYANELFNILNRPLRVCGMVKNEGEPGGGPFIVENNEGVISPQIIESSQINPKDLEQANIFKNSSHFNPVDLVCGVRDFEGRKFNLLDFIDTNTCFISEKSRNGKDLKALELPGLWNGAMAGWNTIFVDVPVSTFNPVKTVNDLLRDLHQ